MTDTTKAGEEARLAIRRAAALLAALDEVENKKKTGLWVAAIHLIFSFGTLLPALWWQGYVIQTLWGWFIKPLDATLGLPTIYSIVGALFVFRACLSMPAMHKGHEYLSASSLRILSFLWPLGFLAVGWLWHWAQWGTVN
jgi:hypothetical protein